MNAFFEEKIWGKIEQYFLNNLCSWGALFIGEVIVASVALFLKDFVAEICVIEPVNAILLSLIWVGFWVWSRKIPKAKKEKIGIVVAIQSFGKKEKIALLNDFKTRLEDLLIKESLGEMDLVLLNEYHSIKVVKQLRQAQKDNNKKAQIEIAQATNGRLLIFGEVKDRVDGVEKCFLNIYAVVAHPKNQKVEEHIKDGLGHLWKRNLCFEKNCEFRGFQITADMIFHVTRYVIGMALYAAGNIAVARKFHLSLYNDKEFLSIKAPSISHIKNKLQDFLAEENGILAYLYWKEDKHAEAEKYVEESIKMKESYSAYLLKCNIAFSYRKDHISALESIKKAKDLVIGKDGTWRYNKGFLMMYRGKYGEALKVYNQIINPRNAYEEEINILNQVYDYNEKYAQVIPDKPWPYFIIGFLKCKKEESAEVEGYEFLEKFLKGAKGKPEYKELVDVAQSCVTAIKKDKWD